MAFYAVTTAAGREAGIASSITDHDNPHIHAVMAPSTLESYILVEADGQTPVEDVVSKTPGAKKVVPGQTRLKEVEGYLSPGSSVDNVAAGDILEVTGGAYKGKTARVKQVDTAEERVTVELEDEPIPIPVSLRGDQIRTLD